MLWIIYSHDPVGDTRDPFFKAFIDQTTKFMLDKAKKKSKGSLTDKCMEEEMASV